MDPRRRAIGFLAAFLLAVSCRTMAGDPEALLLPKLRAGVATPTPNALLTGRLIRDGALLRIDGGGSTVIVWPRTANARAAPGSGNVIVVWPRTATLQRGGGGTTVVVWARGVGVGTPVRVGDRVELIGIITSDNVSGRIAGCPRPAGCAGPVFIASEFRPAPEP
jgi:hypothetical protein